MRDPSVTPVFTSTGTKTNASSATASSANDGPPDALSFYKTQFEGTEKDREQWLQRIDSLKVPHSHFYSIQRQLTAAHDRIAELESELSDLRVQVHSERCNKTSAEDRVRQLEVQALQDKQDLAFLLSSGGASRSSTSSASSASAHGFNASGKGRTCDITYLKNGKPEVSLLRAVNGAYRGTSIPKSSASTLSAGLSSAVSANVRNVGEEPIIRSHISATDIDALRLNVSRLEAFVADSKRTCDEKITALELDRARREDEYAERRRNDKKLMEEITAESERVRDALRAATKEFCVYRNNMQNVYAQLVTELDEERKARKTLESQVLRMRSQLEVERDIVVRAAEERTEFLTAHLRDRAVEKGREAAQVRNQLARTEQECKRTEEKMQEQVKKAQRQAKRAESRRKLEIEGYATEVGMLRKMVVNTQEDHKFLEE